MLHHRLERAQRMIIQLGQVEALVAGKAAAVNPFRHHDVGTAAPGDLDQRLPLAQMLGTAGYVHRDRPGLGSELQPLEQMGADKAHRIKDIQPIGLAIDQTQRTGAGVAVDRILTVAASLAQL